MKKIKGVLSYYSETGTEGAYWSIDEDGKDGYDALNVLGERQEIYLKIFIEDYNKELNVLLFDDKLYLISSFIFNMMMKDNDAISENLERLSSYMQQWPSKRGSQFVLAGMWCHHLPMNIDLKLWEDLVMGRIKHRVEAEIKEKE